MDVDPPPPYPAFVDEVTGAEAKADRLSADNEALADEAADLKRKNDELKAELKKAKKASREEAESIGGKNRSSANDDRENGDNLVKYSDSVRSDSSGDRTGTASDGQDSVLNVEATAYVAMCDSGCTGITATGVDVRDSIYHEGKRVIAVNPAQIPLGSTVHVKSGGQAFEAKAIDTGSDIKNGRIDILVNSKEEAISFGRQPAKVEVLD